MYIYSQNIALQLPKTHHEKAWIRFSYLATLSASFLHCIYMIYKNCLAIPKDYTWWYSEQNLNFWHLWLAESCKAYLFPSRLRGHTLGNGNCYSFISKKKMLSANTCLNLLTPGIFAEHLSLPQREKGYGEISWILFKWELFKWETEIRKISHYNTMTL